jgi:hypothetical protein
MSKYISILKTIAFVCEIAMPLHVLLERSRSVRSDLGEHYIAIQLMIFGVELNNYMGPQ